MRGKLSDEPDSIQLNGWFIAHRASALRQKIRNQVRAEYDPALKQANSWLKYWIKLKIWFLTELRYRGPFGPGPGII
jgi:hypothetical protein